MTEANLEAEFSELCQAIINGMQDKKAEDIVVIDLESIANATFDQFIICTGNSDTHVDSIAESIDHTVSERLNETPINTEGRTNKQWILLDYANVLVHVFLKEKREFYNIEALWGDAKVTAIDKLLEEKN